MNRLINLATPLVAALMGCSNSTAPAVVYLPEVLNIASIRVAGSPESNTWTHDNPISSLALSCDNAPLVVETDPKPVDSAIGAFALAIPGNCGTQISCGWLVLRVVSNDDDTEADIAAATTPIVVQNVNLPGPHTISLELHDLNDNVLHTADGKVLGQEVQIELVKPPSCPASSAGDAG
jgi:hypothetical protein